MAHRVLDPNRKPGNRSEEIACRIPQEDSQFLPLRPTISQFGILGHNIDQAAFNAMYMKHGPGLGILRAKKG